MAKIKIGEQAVDVADRRCVDCKCLQPMEDKGLFTPGKGYTSYHKKPQWVCRTRHLGGCPDIGICLKCQTIVAPYQEGIEKCERRHSEVVDDRVVTLVCGGEIKWDTFSKNDE